jgi:hypothetical protein
MFPNADPDSFTEPDCYTESATVCGNYHELSCKQSESEFDGFSNSYPDNYADAHAHSIAISVCCSNGWRRDANRLAVRGSGRGSRQPSN